MVASLRCRKAGEKLVQLQTRRLVSMQKGTRGRIVLGAKVFFEYGEKSRLLLLPHLTYIKPLLKIRLALYPQPTRWASHCHGIKMRTRNKKQ
jgi:hypothetical protein